MNDVKSMSFAIVLFRFWICAAEIFKLMKHKWKCACLLSLNLQSRNLAALCQENRSDAGKAVLSVWPITDGRFYQELKLGLQIMLERKLVCVLFYEFRSTGKYMKFPLNVTVWAHISSLAFRIHCQFSFLYHLWYHKSKDKCERCRSLCPEMMIHWRLITLSHYISLLSNSFN